MRQIHREGGPSFCVHEDLHISRQIPKLHSFRMSPATGPTSSTPHACRWLLRTPDVMYNTPDPISTLSTSLSLHQSPQYEQAQDPVPSPPMPYASTTIRYPRRRPTHLFQLRHQWADFPSSQKHNDELIGTQLHRSQQCHRHHVRQLLGHAGHEPIHVPLELHGPGVRKGGDMVDVFPTAGIRHRGV